MNLQNINAGRRKYEILGEQWGQGQDYNEPSTIGVAREPLLKLAGSMAKMEWQGSQPLRMNRTLIPTSRKHSKETKM